MRLGKEKNSRSFFFSLLLHLIVLLFLIFSFDFSATMPVAENSNKNPELVVNAMVMNSPPLVIQQQPVLKPEKPIVKKSEKIQIQPIKKPVIVIADKKLQQEKIAKQLLADIQKETKQQKKLKQKALENAFAKDMKQLAQKSLQQQLQKEQQRITDARQHAAETKGVVDKYKALVLQTISQNWLIPTTVNKNLYVELLIRVAPGGMVLDVQLTKSSGDENLDRSARAAIFKSSPLPVPSDPNAFDQFRQFALKMKPENILANTSWQN